MSIALEILLVSIKYRIQKPWERSDWLWKRNTRISVVYTQQESADVGDVGGVQIKTLYDAFHSILNVENKLHLKGKGLAFVSWSQCFSSPQAKDAYIDR